MDHNTARLILRAPPRDSMGRSVNITQKRRAHATTHAPACDGFHLVELAIAGGAEAIATKNVKDFKGAELRFTGLCVVRPEDLIAE